jgi:hypothetical protein
MKTVRRVALMSVVFLSACNDGAPAAEPDGATAVEPDSGSSASNDGGMTPFDTGPPPPVPVSHTYPANDGPDRNPLKGWNSGWWNDSSASSVGYYT